MPDQNQNSQNPLPGTLRTLKTDLDKVVSTNPQDRLLQSGNFIQARPTLDTPPEPISVLNSSQILTTTTNTTVSTNAENKVLEKKDIPANEVKSKPSYSWSNMSPAQNTSSKLESSLDFKKDIQSNSRSKDNKSALSVLKDTIDLPLENKGNIEDFNKNSNEKSTSGLFKVEPKILNSTLEGNLDGKNFQEKDVDTMSKLPMKKVLSILFILLLLFLIGVGIYIFNQFQNNISTKTTKNTTELNTPPVINQDLISENSLFKDVPKADISFVDTEPIRQTILSKLIDKKDILIELILTKDGDKLALIDVADALTLTIPNDILASLKGYWLYGYNQEGIYKLTAVIQLNSDKKAKEFVDNWQNSIPSDLSGFSISLPSRIVNNPVIKNTTITNNSGKSFNNNYYNYTSPSDSIDVSSYENYILMASSQDSMKYILNQIP